MKSSKVFLLALSALVFQSTAVFSEPRVIIDKEKASAPAEAGAKGRAAASGKEEAALLTEIPADIQTLEGLQKWLKKFPEEKVVVKLGATWCGPCTQLHPEIEKFAQEQRGNVKVLTIDIDNNPALKNALAGGSKVPAIVTLKNDGQSAPSAPIVGYIPGKTSPIGDWLRRNSGKIDNGSWL